MVRRPEPRAADRRRHGHERQDHDVVPGRGGPRGSGIRDGADRHGRHPHRRPAASATRSRTRRPGALDLQRILREMVDAGEQAVVIETSSHGLAADRVASVDYDGAIFTNLSHEHLDFHGTFDAYRWAKLSLFERLPQHAKGGRPGRRRDQRGRSAMRTRSSTRRAARRRCRSRTATRLEADVRLIGIKSKVSRSRLRVDSSAARRAILDLRLPGRFNAHNAMAVLGARPRLGPGPRCRVGRARGRRGRARPDGARRRGQPFMVVVDYAHTLGVARCRRSASSSRWPRRAAA